MQSEFRLRPVILVLLAVFTLGLGIAVPSSRASALTTTAARASRSVLATSAATPVPSAGVRRPAGIYAHVILSQLVKDSGKTNGSKKSANVDSEFTHIYQESLANPAISGLTVGAMWNLLNPNPPTSANAYDWTYLGIFAYPPKKSV